MKKLLLFLTSFAGLLLIGNSAFAQKPIISYASPVTLTVGVAVNIIPANTGGAATAASVTNGPLPAGLVLNPNGSITGIPTANTAVKIYTIRPSNGSGNQNNPLPTITITVVTAVPNFTYASPQVYTYGTAIATLTPANTGSPSTTCTITPALPAGLFFNIVTGVITGTPTAVSATTLYTITSSNSAGAGPARTVTITVNPAPVTVTAATANAKVYDGATTATFGAGGTLNGVLAGDVANVTLNKSGAFSSANVGTPVSVNTTFALTGSKAVDYVLTQPTLSANITAVPLTITANGPAKTYGTALATGAGANFSITGTLVTGQAATSVTLTPNAAGLSATTAAGAAYTVTPSLATGTGGFLASNYTITYAPFNGTVTPAALTITANNVTVQMGVVPAFSVTYTGFVNGDTQANLTTQPTETTTATTASGSGGYPITVSGAVDGNYTITYTGGTLTVTGAGANTFDWTGAVSTAWNTPGNWDIKGAPQTLLYPGSSNNADVVDIGVNFNFTARQPSVTVAIPNSVGAINFGTNNGNNVTLIVNTVTLTVTGAVTQNHNNGNGALNTAVTGTGALSCNSFVVGDATLPPAPGSYDLLSRTGGPVTNLTTVASTIANLTITTSLNLNTTSTVASNYNLTLFGFPTGATANNSSVNNAEFDLNGGTITVNNINTTNTAYVNKNDGTNTVTNSATYTMDNGTAVNQLNLLGATAATLASGGTVDFVGSGTVANSTVNYAATSGTQKVYTSADAGIGTTPTIYPVLTLSGGSTKSVDGGNLTIGSNFNSSGGTVDFTTNNPAIIIEGNYNNTGAYTGNNMGTGGVSFLGATQSLFDNSAVGTTFNNVTFGNSGVKTMSASGSGLFAVSSSGILTMSGTAVLAAGGVLTLRSDVTGSAAIAPLTTTNPITGNVNVERYFSAKRGYRLISSPVHANASGANIYSLNYLLSSLYVTGTGAGFTATGNPTLYLFDEGFVPQFTTFLNSNYIGISSLNTGTGANPTYTINVNGAGLAGPFNLPVATGVLCFFRGNLSEGAANLTNPSFSALAATTTTAGTLNTGQVVFRNWYTGGAALGSASQNFNLVGNPYASAIDLGAIPTATTTTGIFATPFASGTGITKFIYELNPITNVFGVYTDDNSVAPTNGASRYIASGQGFFVQAFGAGTTLIFNESGKATTGSTPNITNNLLVLHSSVAAVTQTTANTNPLISLKLAVDTINSEETLFLFNPAAQTKYVLNEDAFHRDGTGKLGFSSFSSDRVPLAINTMPLQKAQTIGLNLSGKANGVYTINMTMVRALPAIYDVWLMDAYQKDSVDLKANPTYSFNILNSDTASVGANRFKLVIRENPAKGLKLLAFTGTKTNNGAAQLVWTTVNEQNLTNFAVQRSTDNGATYNVIGGFISTGAGSYSFLDKNPPKGIIKYRLQLTDFDGAITYSNYVELKFTTQDGDNGKGNIAVYPNPARSIINVVINDNNNSGNTSELEKIGIIPGLNNGAKPVQVTYGIKIISLTGNVVVKEISKSGEWQDNVSLLVPGTYIIQVVNNKDQSFIGRTSFIKL